VLFVVFFTIFLALAGYAIDQNFFFGRRRVAQRDADAAARGGALAYMRDVNAPDFAAAAARAEEVASSNTPDGPPLDAATGAGNCPLPGGATIPDAPSLRVEVEQTAPSLFLRAFGVSSIDVSARATACVGAVTDLRWDDATNDPNGDAINILLDESDVNPGGCFEGGTLVYGRECIIFAAHTLPDGHPRLIAGYDPGDIDDCFQGDTVPGGINGIEDGVAFTCSVGDAIDSETPNPPGHHQQVIGSMRNRIQSGSGCSHEALAADDSFQNALGNGDGGFGEAPLPVALGGPATDYVYVQNDCFDHPRVVLLPVTDDGGASISGWTAVFILGCFDLTVPISPGAATTNDCPPGGGPAEDKDVRGIPIRIFVTEGAIGDIDSTGNPAPLTIQTVE
jgi:hypothetical protein